jgi:hypothetical protein
MPETWYYEISHNFLRWKSFETWPLFYMECFLWDLTSFCRLLCYTYIQIMNAVSFLFFHFVPMHCNCNFVILLYLYGITKLFMQLVYLENWVEIAKYFSFLGVNTLNTNCILNLKLLCLLEVP